MDEAQKVLLEKITNSIKSTVDAKKIGVAFSGGVDSTMMAKILSSLGYDVTLLTVGFKDSHDIVFAKQVNEQLGLPHKILEIDPKTFEKISKDINTKIKTDNLSWNENCIAFYYVSKLASKLGIRVVVTANGIDELFCGYNAYRDVVSDGESAVLELMEKKLANEIEMMKAVNHISSENDVKILQPLLTIDFIDFEKKIPLYDKINDKDDLIRKHIIRKLALSVGVPEVSATKRKKALQYGTKIHKTLLKSR
ncbi:MAG: asparagine synthase [Crenarchaeota archaeon]|nr:MAG: asparagine synthase [Thermoproteota archaeon]